MSKKMSIDAAEAGMAQPKPEGKRGRTTMAEVEKAHAAPAPDPVSVKRKAAKARIDTESQGVPDYTPKPASKK